MALLELYSLTARSKRAGALTKKLAYDVLKDFIGITPMARQVGMLVVHPSLPVRTTKDFIAVARARPGEVIYASAGNGSFVHLTMALFASMANLKMTHVPYKGGGPVNIALLAGEAQAAIATIGSIFPPAQGRSPAADRGHLGYAHDPVP